MSVRPMMMAILGSSVLAMAIGVASQSGELGAGEPPAPRADEKREALNLKVLPKDISPADLAAVMRQYDAALGVSCEYCHTRDSDTRWDYASDDNPAKHTARLMIAMVNEINTKYLSQIGDSRYAVLVTCGNCHQGQSDPPTFDSLEAGSP